MIVANLRGIKMDTKSFTLIEMLVVIAIIAILASLMMPSMRTAVESGRTVLCMNNLKQQGVTQMLYSGDYYYTLAPAQSGDTLFNRHCWWNKIAPYTDRSPVPSDYASGSWKHFFKDGILWCPSRKEEAWTSYGKYQCGYAVNSFGSYPNAANVKAFKQVYVSGSQSIYAFRAGASLGGSDSPSKLLHMADVNYENTGSRVGYTNPTFASYEYWVPGTLRNNAAYRHNETGNVLFLDGHCSAVFSFDLEYTLMMSK